MTRHLSYVGGGFAADIVGGFANAAINEWENSTRIGEKFNLVKFGYDAVLYTTLNTITNTPKNATLNQIHMGIAYTGVAMSSGYTISDGFLKEAVVDFVNSIVDKVHPTVVQGS